MTKAKVMSAKDYLERVSEKELAELRMEYMRGMYYYDYKRRNKNWGSNYAGWTKWADGEDPSKSSQEFNQTKFEQALPRLMHWKGLLKTTTLHEEKRCFFCIDLKRRLKKMEMERDKLNVVERL